MKQKTRIFVNAFAAALIFGSCAAWAAAPETEAQSEAVQWEAPRGFESAEEAAEAFAEAYIEEDAYGVVLLYADETMEYLSGKGSNDPEKSRDLMLSTWQASFDAGDTGIETYEITECRELTKDEFEDRFDDYLTAPEEACRVTVSFPPCTDVSGTYFPDGLDYYCFTACFDDLWYLVL